jgi:peptidoglycan/LPS O-acetylase OafA/YrhL
MKLFQRLTDILKLELNPNRVYGLDILRALAIFFVVLAHGDKLMPPERYKYFHYIVFDGVAIFFVLSGFLIGGILIKILNEKELTFSGMLNFWKRRWFRTLPNYFLILSILIILNILFTSDFTLLDKLQYYIFSQNLFWEHPTFFPEAWSLSIEEWFYLLIPLIIYFFIRVFKFSPKKSVLIAAIVILISVTLFRYFRYINLDIDSYHMWDKMIRRQVFTRLDSLMYGIIGAYVYFYFGDFWKKYKWGFFALGIFMFIMVRYNIFKFPYLGLYKSVFSFSLNSMATLLVLPLLTTIKSGKGFVYKAVTYMSLISYSMYLINLMLVREWIVFNLNLDFVASIHGYLFLMVRYFMFWFLTIVLSIIIYKYFEIPMTSLRDSKKK